MAPASKCLQYSLWLTFLNKTNVIIISLTGCAVIYTRSAGVAFFAVGAIACSLSVKLVKFAVQQPRPSIQNYGSRRKTTYGMPSTHSAAIVYLATSICLSSLYLPLHHSFPSDPNFRVLLPLLTLPWATLIVMSRVWLGHHTWSQVAVGTLYGAVFAFFWFMLWHGGLNKYGNEVERLQQTWI